MSYVKPASRLSYNSEPNAITGISPGLDAGSSELSFDNEDQLHLPSDKSFSQHFERIIWGEDGDGSDFNLYNYKLIFEPRELGGYNVIRKNVERFSEAVLAGTIRDQGIPIVNAEVLLSDGQVFKANESGHFQGVVYRSPVFVASDASGANNGRSWKDAFNKLEDAVKHEEPSDEIWVKKGVYKPRSTLVPVSGIKILGGFSGDESVSSQRDWIANPTIISGEYSEYGSLFSLKGGNSLDGFIIERTTEMAIYSYDGSVVSNCIIRNNSGRAIRLTDNGLLNNSIIINNNSSDYVIRSDNSAVRIENCLIAGNTNIVNRTGRSEASIISGFGEISGCTIVGNMARLNSFDVAGAISYGYLDPQNTTRFFRVTNTIISGNSKAGSGSQIGTFVKLESSCIFGETPNDPNVFTFDPQFLDVLNVAGADGILMTDDDGLQLSATSPLINLGNIIFTQNSIDVARQERIAQGAPDIGAYESNSTRAHEKPAELRPLHRPTLFNATVTSANGPTTFIEFVVFPNVFNCLDVIDVAPEIPEGNTMIYPDFKKAPYYLRPIAKRSIQGNRP